MDWYTTLIFEALSIMNKSEGCTISEIMKSIEQRRWVPKDFSQLLSIKLTDLVLMGKLEMDQNCFKIKVSCPSQSELRDQTLEEALAHNARMKAEAKRNAILATKVVELLERVETMSKENDANLRLAQEIREKCKIQRRTMTEEADAMLELVNEIYRQ